MTPGHPPRNIVAFPPDALCADRTDAALMLRFALEEDAPSFDELVRRYYAPALAIARGRLRDAPLAQDVVQETFVRVFRERRRYDATRSFAAWFYTILRNAATDAARRRTRHCEKLDLFADSVPESSHPALPAGNHDCDTLLSALSPADRELLVLHHIHGMSFWEIAEVLRISPEAAKKRAQRSLKKLQVIVSQGRLPARTAYRPK